MALLCWVVLLLLAGCAMSARILGFSAIGGSHYIMISNTMEELASRGHEVALVVPSAQPTKSIENVTHKIFHIPQEAGASTQTLTNRLIEEGNKLEVYLIMDERNKETCESLLNNTGFLKDLKNFDLIVYDIGAPCAVLVGDLYDIPRVEILPAPPTTPFAMWHMVPMPVSYIPQIPTGFSEQMTFPQRLSNLGSYIAVRLFLGLVFGRSMNNLKVKYNIKPERSYQQAVGDAELLIIAADFALEYSQPLLPGNVMVGPLNVKVLKPLPPDLEEFVNSSGGHGFIIVSFGSNVASSLGKEKVDMLATAFGKLKEKVIWRLKGYIPSFLGPNIKIVDWLPQNDLLAHKKIRAFISHVGHSSLYESAYHGVPLVAFPLFADQFSNAKKAEYFGLGLAVNHKSVTAQELFETVRRVVSEPRFKTEAARISRLLKDSPRTPLEKTGDWIEYVIRHGGARHLRAQVFNIPWYQYYLLDVMAILVAMVILVVMVIRLTCRCVCRLCCRKSDSKTKKE